MIRLAILSRLAAGAGSADSAGACASLVARLGCGEWAVTQLCSSLCESLTPLSLAAAQAAQQAGPVELPLLFMEPADLFDTWGHQQQVAPPVVDITQLLCNASRPCNLTFATKGTLQGGLLAPNPQHPEAGYEIFFESTSNHTALHYGSQEDSEAAGDAAPPPPKKEKKEVKSIYFTTTVDFLTYTVPVPTLFNFNLRNPEARRSSCDDNWGLSISLDQVRVGQLNNFVNPIPLKTVSCIPKSMTRSDDGKTYVILTICRDAGLRPMVASGPLGVDSFSAQKLVPAFYDRESFDDPNLPSIVFMRVSQGLL